MIVRIPYLMNIRPYSVTLVQYFDSETNTGECFTLKPQESIAESTILVSDTQNSKYNEFLLNRYIKEFILTRVYREIVVADPDPEPGPDLANLIITTINPQTWYYDDFADSQQMDIPPVYLYTGATLSDDRLYYIVSDTSLPPEPPR